MKKLALLVLTGLLVTTQPALRAEVGSRVGPVVDKAGLPHPVEMLNPLFGWSVRNELRVIARQLEQEVRTGGKLPKQKEFKRYLQRSHLASSGYDAWSTEYKLTVRQGTAWVQSAGPDRIHGTIDDMQETIALR